MLKNKLKFILIIIISILISSSLTAYATYNYFAKDVSYIKPDGTEVSVENALNELYNNKSSTNITFLDAKIVPDYSNLDLNYTSNFNGKILIVLTHVNYNNSLVSLNGSNLELTMYTEYYNSTEDPRRLEYVIVDVSVGDTINCFTNTISPSGATLIWSYSSCSLYSIK